MKNRVSSEPNINIALDQLEEIDITNNRDSRSIQDFCSKCLYERQKILYRLSVVIFLFTFSPFAAASIYYIWKMRKELDKENFQAAQICFEQAQIFFEISQFLGFFIYLVIISACFFLLGIISNK
jgi:hypothetical protein